MSLGANLQSQTQDLDKGKDRRKEHTWAAWLASVSAQALLLLSEVCGQPRQQMGIRFQGSAPQGSVFWPSRTQLAMPALGTCPFFRAEVAKKPNVDAVYRSIPHQTISSRQS